MSHSTSFLSFITLLISLISFTLIHLHAQVVSSDLPSSLTLPLSHIQIQFPSISPPGTPDQLLLDTAYMTPALPYVLYTSLPQTTLSLNITFRSNLSSAATRDSPIAIGEQYYLILRMIDSEIMSVEKGMNLTSQQSLNSTPGVIELHNISYSTYSSIGNYYTVFSALPENNTYYWTLTHSHFSPSLWSYRIETTQDPSRITNSPTVVGEIYFRQYPTIWNLTQPAPLTESTAFRQMFHGLALDSTFYAGLSGPAIVLPGAFTCEILLSMRRIADGKLMNDNLIANGIISIRAHWLDINQSQPTYFNLDLFLTSTPSSPYQRLPLPPSHTDSLRYQDYYILKLDEFMSLDTNINNTSTDQPTRTTTPVKLIFASPKRVSQWKITFPSLVDGTTTVREVADNYDTLSEYEYSTQQQDYHLTIPPTQASCLFSFENGIHGSSGVSILTWYNSFVERNFDELNHFSSAGNPYPIVQVPLPVQDQQTRIALVTSAGQNITWWLKRSPTVPVVVNQTQVLQSYQQQVTTLQTASKNLTSSGTTDVFIPLSQSSNSYVALQRFTSDHTTTVLLPTEFVSKKIQISVTPSSSSSSTSMNSAVRRDVYMITRTPNPLNWANPSEGMEVIPDSPVISITLADTDGVLLTNSPLNEGNLSVLTSYSYSVIQSYDTHDVPECRIYDPSSLQWIRDGVITQLSTTTATLQCFSSTPGTIALLRKIIIRSDVDPDTDGGRLRYGHAKNDIALVVGLLMIAGVLFLFMFICGLVSFMRETRVMQAQINELKKAMMVGRDSRDCHDSSNSEEGDPTQDLPSTPMIQHNNRSDDQPHQHISSSHHVNIIIHPNNSYSDRISSPQNLPPVVSPRKAPYPRIADLAPEFRPLSDDELALHYGPPQDNSSNNANSMDLHTIDEDNNDDFPSRLNLI